MVGDSMYSRLPTYEILLRYKLTIYKKLKFDSC
jgi:hypothetical protein